MSDRGTVPPSAADRPAAATVTLDVWRVPPGAVPAAMVGTVTHTRRLRRRGDVRFVKVLGTADDRFTPGAADLTRWAVLTVWTTAPAQVPVPAWARRATASWHARLVPLASRGRWSGAAPFGDPTRDVAAAWDGPVLALTRARIKPTWTLRFWRAVPPVAGVLPDTDGLQAAFGVGEAPVGVQGTVSLWRDAAAVRAFARGDAAHREVVARTYRDRWYAEELFARLAVVATSGSPAALSRAAGRAA